MTGFGRGETTADNKTFVVEIKTINHRYNDISIRMPRFLSSLEDKIREYIQTSISRGKIDVYISYNSFGLENKNLIYDEELAEEYVNILGKIKEDFKMKDEISLSLVARFPDLIRVENKDEDQEQMWNLLVQALDEAVKNTVKMRENEGARLKEDIIKRLFYIKDVVKSIEERSPIVVEEYRQRLNNRIKELLNNTPVDEQRIAMEVAIMADKGNVTEEIVRLFSHINQMISTLDFSETIGRKLDFIVQEMNREANTINSKSQDITIINSIVDVKSEIEKIREQIQNIE